MIDEFDLDYDERECNDLDNIPTTNIGKDPFEITCPQIIPGHVLLNNYGDYLVKKNYTLKSRWSEQHMIESIVSTSDIKCDCLLYSIAKIFPSIF